MWRKGYTGLRNSGGKVYKVDGVYKGGSIAEKGKRVNKV